MNFWTNVGLTGGIHRSFLTVAILFHFIVYYPIDLINIAEEFVNQTKDLKNIKFEFEPAKSFEFSARYWAYSRCKCRCWLKKEDEE